MDQFKEQMQIYTEKEKKLKAKLKAGLREVVQLSNEIDTLEYNIKQLQKLKDKNAQISEVENISIEAGRKIETGRDVGTTKKDRT